ncbi:hypothetical protein [Azospirillum tabaci]|uniref:hypothetical protein n=1 Tax=Azospirillum tabaci TaxID=2752310 RepID=UPI001661129B|nr:hypothetical protein [Azospirillum tabaci]
MRKSENRNIAGYNNSLGRLPYYALNKQGGWEEFTEESFIRLTNLQFRWYIPQKYNLDDYRTLTIDAAVSPQLLLMDEFDFEEKKSYKYVAGAAFKTKIGYWVLQQIGRNNCGSTCAAMLGLDNNFWNADRYISTQDLPSLKSDTDLVIEANEYFGGSPWQLVIDANGCSDSKDEPRVEAWITSGASMKESYIYTVGSHYIIVDAVYSRLIDNEFEPWALVRDPTAGWQITVPLSSIVKAIGDQTKAVTRLMIASRTG